MKYLFMLFFAYILLFPTSLGCAKLSYYDDYTGYAKVIRVNTFAEKLSYYESGKK